MRLTSLLAVLLFIVIVFFASPAASFAQAPADQDRPPVFRDKSADELFEAMRNFAAHGGLEMERDGVCYTLRTYVMARDEKDSDSTHTVRATRCLPGNRIQFKTAIAPARPAAPADR